MVDVVVVRDFDTKICRVGIDGVTLQFKNNRATKTLPEGPHILTWYVLGNPGNTYDITFEEPPGIKCHPNDTLKGTMDGGACKFKL